MATASCDLHAAYYLGFTLDHDEAAAAQTFAARFGAPPEYVVEDRGVLFVGPVPEAQKTIDKQREVW